jgi:GMP synthase (glutamine-hydrolysing)
MADLCECKGAVLCGTALMDNEYAKSQELFSWIAGWDKPLLGICAGMQVIGTAYGARIIKQKEIGYRSIEITAKSRLLGDPRTIEGYHLHNFSSTIPEGFLLLAGNRNCVEAFKHENKETYGILFHPEVRNRWILEEFCRSLKKTA